MPRFKVEFASSDGRVGVLDVDSASEKGVLALLETRGQTAISVRPVDNNAKPAGPRSLRGGRGLRRAVLDFTHQMTAVAESGIPVIAGIGAIAEQTGHAGLRQALIRIRGRVEGGQSLAEAMSAEPHFFPPIYVKTLAAGETSGKLAEVFGSLAQYLEDSAETRSQVLSALTYPFLVVGALTLATIAMLVFVIPKFAEMFSKFDTALPVPTRVVMGASNALRNHWAMLLLALVAIIFGMRTGLRNQRFRTWFDEKKLRLPVFGKLFVGAYMHRLVELLNLLTRSALPIVQTLRVTAESMENEAIRNDVRKMTRAVEGGKTLGEAFGETRWLTPLVKRMLAIGEHAGRTDQIFDYLSRYYGRETKRIVKTLSTLIEPILIGSLAVVILFFALAIFLPMLKVLKMVGTA